MENGYEVLKSHYEGIISKVTSVSEVFKKENASIEDESPWTINPMVSFINGNASIGLSYSEEDELTGETDRPWMWWVENVAEDEYHRFATFEEALADWVANLPRIDRLAKKVA